MDTQPPTNGNNFIKRILIIDDNDVDRYILRRNIITAMPAREITEVDTGEKALNILTGRATQFNPMPELIFLDINMAPMTGLEFLDVFDKLSAQYQNSCRIIVIASADNEKEKELAMSNAHVAGYYLKPITVETLMRISDHLNHRQAS